MSNFALIMALVTGRSPGDLYEQFANAVVETRHLITETGDHPAQLAELISRRRDEDQFRYSAS